MSEQKTLILIIGCHRSGTSAVAGALAQAGVNFGTDLIGPAPDNLRGFFESRRVVKMHDAALEVIGASWDKPPGGLSCLTPELRLRMKEAAQEILADLDGQVVGVKDPRATLFVEIWREACAEVGIRCKVLHVSRDRGSVMDSLMHRNGFTRKEAGSLVDHYRRCAEADSMIVFPEQMASLQDWLRVFDDLDLPLDPAPCMEFFDARLVHHRRRSLFGSNGFDRPLWTVVCPSGRDDNLPGLVGSLLDSQPETTPDQVVVVSNGLSRATRAQVPDVAWKECRKPFIFARNVNDGVELADPHSDIVIIGDDVRFVTPNALDRLYSQSRGAAAVAASVHGLCGQPAQRAGSGARSAHWLAFICVYIPRKIWGQVGPLDERFTEYGFDDVDWCMRALQFGELRIAHDVQVVHLEESRSKWRSDPAWKESYARGREIFNAKWEPIWRDNEQASQGPKELESAAQVR